VLPVDAGALILFEDDFEGDSLDLGKWDVVCTDEYRLGVTYFCLTPSVSDGKAILKHQTWNPNPYSDDPGFHALGTEIRSELYFLPSAGEPIELEATVRVGDLADGQVTSFFAYMQKMMGSAYWNDEVDFEFLSNQINHPVDPSGHQVWLATYDDFHGAWNDCLYLDPATHCSANPVVPGLDLHNLNLFKIRWSTDRVEWFVNNVIVGSTDDMPESVVPDEPINLRFNFWGCNDPSWPEACDPSFQPAERPDENHEYYYELSRVVVKVTPEPSTALLLACGLASLALRRQLAS